MTRRVWNDRALESPRAGQIAIGAGAAGIVTGAVCLALGVIGGAPWWLFPVVSAAMIVCVAAAAGGRHAVRDARHHAEQMHAYGATITASFEALLEERAKGQ